MSMRRTIIISLISLLFPILSFSQTTYPQIVKDSLIIITPLQLKKTNLIFAEHSRIKKEIILLEEIIYYKDSTINLMEETCNLQRNQITNYSNINYNQEKQIEFLNSELVKTNSKKNKYKNWAIGGCSLSIGFILLLVL